MGIYNPEKNPADFVLLATRMPNKALKPSARRARAWPQSSPPPPPLTHGRTFFWGYNGV